MDKNVLIVTEEWAGSGHYMAAIALQEALLAHSCEVRLIGGLGIASPMLRELSRSSYYTSLAHFPALWDHLYNRNVSAISRALQKPLAKVLGKRLLERVIEQQKPDAVISTHAYCLSALVEARKRASKPFWLIGILTDFHVHPYWLHHGIDFYNVAHPKLAEQMSGQGGIEPNRVKAYGIPLRQSFQGNQQRNKKDWKKQVGIAADQFMVLICGGADGYGDMVELVECLWSMRDPLTIVAVTGKNEPLLRRLTQRFARTQHALHQLHVFGYVQEMWRWLGAADAVITKAGGLTCSEALAMRTPLILYQPLPGQEKQNCRFLIEQGLAWQADTGGEAASIVMRLQQDDPDHRMVMERMERYNLQDSATQIAKWLKTMEGRKIDTYYSQAGNISP
ncbi:glycosyl transferase [Brevibacillus fluminis]|uniref:Glycosyl transferase n=1 Tax=Brevibacillus fluminis TaxID=511487 RepID=A0A3M8DIA0_9BACL|nr:glycosyltransferase [Brevibacillus fluminis]RNB87832.1 glycosyl transferase [Brevibacillus fluminis]